MDMTAFTTSVENVLSAYLNRNRHVEYQTGLVQLVAPVRSFFLYGETWPREGELNVLRRRTRRDLANLSLLPYSSTCPSASP